jgi:hypothetical protein
MGAKLSRVHPRRGSTGRYGINSHLVKAVRLEEVVVIRAVPDRPPITRRKSNMATKPKQSPAMMLQQLDGIQNDQVTVHFASPVDVDLFLKQFATPAKRCRTHADCVTVTYRPVAAPRGGR